MKTSSARSRRHRNPPTQEAQAEQQPFFSRGHTNAPGVQTKREAFFQPKLIIGQAGDQYEQEADAVANKVVASQSAGVDKAAGPSVQRMATPEEKQMPATNDGRMAEDKRIQRKPDIQAMDAPKKEEEKPTVQKAEAPKKEEEKPTVQKAEAPKKEEEKPTVQKAGAPKKEEEKPVQKMEMPEKKKEEGGPPVIQKAGAPKEEEAQDNVVQAKAQAGGSVATPAVTAKLDGTRGRGNRLPDKTRSQMEQAFGRDFSGVSIHTDSASAELNNELHAQAFTHGKDVYFNAGKFDPDSTEGKHLLAHELTHVVQQNTDTLARKENPLKNYTLTKTVWYKDEESVDKALKNSTVLQSFISGKLKGGFSIEGKVDYPRTDKEFASTFHSAFPGDTYVSDIRGFYDRSTNKIVVAPNPTIEVLIHESIHNLSSGLTRGLGSFLNEGITQVFTNAILNEYKLGTGKAYEAQAKGAALLQDAVGFNVLASSYFVDKNLTAFVKELKSKKPHSDWGKLIRSKTAQEVTDALQ